jgi:hypothetical protein
MQRAATNKRIEVSSDTLAFKIQIGLNASDDPGEEPSIVKSL